MPIDTSAAILVTSGVDLDRWLSAHAAERREVVVAIFNKASGRQTVNLSGLQEVAACHGWVDTQIKRINDERYAIRFVPRRPGSNWTEGNRAVARRLLAEGRLTPAGIASLPDDLQAAGSGQADPSRSS